MNKFTDKSDILEFKELSGKKLVEIVCETNFPKEVQLEANKLEFIVIFSSSSHYKVKISKSLENHISIFDKLVVNILNNTQRNISIEVKDN